MKKDRQKKALWLILKPVQNYINRGFILAGIGASFLIITLSILAFFLSSLAENKPFLIFDYEIGKISTIILIAFCGLSAAILRLFAFRSSHLGAFELEEILRVKLSENFARLPLGFIITNGSGALKKVFLDDVKNLHSFVADSTPIIAKSIVSSLLSLVILFIVDYKFALVSLGVFLCGAFIMKIAMKDYVPLRKKYEKAQTNINKSIIEFVQAMPIVRTFDDGKTSFKRYHEALVEFKDSMSSWVEKSSFSSRVSLIVLSPLPTLIFILFMGVYLLKIDSLEFSSFIAALFLSTGLADSLMPLMLMFDHIRKSDAAAKRIEEILSETKLPLSQNPKVPKESSVEFENVSFAYEEKEVLNGISFYTPANSITALVGTSGAGKSTIAKLIPRFWDIKSGCIKIGGVDVRDISYETLMKNVSFVFQDTFLFNDTIYNNIAMANYSKTKEEVKLAAKSAQIHDFIESLENGYETKVNDRGINLSGGQKQRITIARAILRDAPIIILDEATAFADPENEEEIIKALSHLVKNKTVIIIAHRLSTIKDSNQIVVLKDGKVVEVGTHDELLENKDAYAKLWESYEIAQSWTIGAKNEK